MIDVNGVEMRTEAQWAQKYRAVLKRQIEKGVRREWYVPGGKTAEAVFYREDQTRPYNKRELQKAKKKRRQASEYTLWKRRLRRIAKRPAVPCDNPSGIIVFDTETTGLDPGKGRDEILQLSIIDGDGNILINTYIKPRWHDKWPKAAEINGITPEMVADAPDPEEIISTVKGIFESADMLIAYNGRFDLSFLDVWGIRPSEEQAVVDVMLEFAEVYGERNYYYGGYKWQKLTTAASYYGYKFAAHDSLEDVRATLFIYRKMREGES